MRDTWIILQDQREKSPLPFPEHLAITDTTRAHARTTTVRLVIERATLPYGDYVLAADPLGVMVERKATIDEVLGNVMGGEQRRSNFVRELVNMQNNSRNPILLFEQTLLGATKGKGYSDLPAYVAMDHLLALLVHHRVSPVFTPGTTISHRRATAEFVARLMIQGCIHGHTKATP